MIDEREEATGEECIPVEVGEEFWKVIDVLGRELGERIVLMEEDVGKPDFFARCLHYTFHQWKGPIRSRTTHPKEAHFDVWEKEEGQGEGELVSVETEAEFHAALDRGADVELTHELAEKIGLMVEDVGTLEDIKAARFDPYN